MQNFIAYFGHRYATLDIEFKAEDISKANERAFAELSQLVLFPSDWQLNDIKVISL